MLRSDTQNVLLSADCRRKGKHLSNMAEPRTYSILVVDDNDALRESVRRVLARKGCQVTTATNGLEGLEALRGQPFDAIVSDVQMPERGGVWLWQEALALRPTLRGRFLLMSGEPLAEQRSMGIYIDDERFLLKPVSLETVWLEVQGIIQAAESREREPTPDLAPGKR